MLLELLADSVLKSSVEHGWYIITFLRKKKGMRASNRIIKLNKPFSSSLCQNKSPPTGSFSCKSSSFPYERFCKKPRFETEAQGNSENVFSAGMKLIQFVSSLFFVICWSTPSGRVSRDFCGWLVLSI